MSKIKIPKYIKPAGWVRESIAFLLDFAFDFILAIFIYAALGQTVLFDAAGGNAGSKEYSLLAADSGFASLSESGSAVDFSFDSAKSGTEYYSQYALAEAKIWDYFYVKVSLGENFSFLDSDAFSSSSEKGTAGYLNDVGKWIYRSFFSITSSDSFFAYDSSQTDFSFMPVPSKLMETKLNSSDEAIKKAAYKDLFNVVYGEGESQKNSLYAKAVTHFGSQASVIKAKAKVTNAYYISALPSIIVPPLIFFLLFPLIFSNGETLGKKIFKIGLLNRYGYVCPKSQTLAHYLILIAVFYIFLIPYPLYSFMGFCLVLLLDYMTMIMNKNHQSIHGLISRTLVIKTDTSIWFASKKAEDDYIGKHPNSLPAKMKKEAEEEANAPEFVEKTTFDSSDFINKDKKE